jgi:hypothetical protein
LEIPLIQKIPPNSRNVKAVTGHKGKVVVVDQDVLKSKAWLSLSGIAPQVYMLFMARRRMEKTKQRRGKETWQCTNDKELIFTYREAENKYGITQTRFCRAIDMLIAHGFLDIVKPGKAVAKEATEYGLSERWRDYGKPSFHEASRKKVKVGFCRTQRAPARREE